MTLRIDARWVLSLRVIVGRAKAESNRSLSVGGESACN